MQRVLLFIMPRDVSPMLGVARLMPFYNSPRNERDPNLYLETETSFRQDMITTSFDEQWAKPISRAKSAESQ
jgi:hypothetical protein